ncbi:MAG: aminoglycoside phosphotransferase family protein [Treponema sp.]|nr:aminoglycoside phosphotransferase family protein [Treponema sp.]
MQDLLSQFAIYGDFEEAGPFGGGHINSTFRSSWRQAGTRLRYLHQRINTQVFRHPEAVMENILRVTSHIAAGLAASGSRDISRQVLSVVAARNGRPFVIDGEGGFWRSYLFIEGAYSREVTETPEEAAFLGAGAGRFQKQLVGLGGPRLHETIPDFHHMERRYQRFREALDKDAFHRAASLGAEIDYMEANAERGAVLIRALRSGKIPERICHNDAKMNNLLLDKKTGEALAIVDLDTVMPGSALFDTGDLIRTVCNRAAEDERELSRVVFEPAYFRALISGYLSESAGFLTEAEKRLIPESGRSFAQIMGLRFLTDYLEGDHYYHIARPEHNLDRCRTQIALMRSMDAQWEEITRLAADAA